MLKGLRALVTCGPTHEPIDPVRYIANYSSGKQGYAIAKALQDAGVVVTVVHGPVSELAIAGTTDILITTADEMLAACSANLPVDIAVCAAAVCDWKPAQKAPVKLKKASGQETLTLELVRNPDILQFIAMHPDKRPACVIGFAAETDHMVENARVKLKEKGCDMIVANGISATHTPFGSDDNEVCLVTNHGTIPWPRATKKEIAAQLVKEIEDFLSKGHVSQ